MSEFSLMELFREELKSNLQVLSDGLLALEQGAGPDQIEPLMRAAHSIKGAARVVGVDLAVSLAHVMEECLVHAQRGQLSLGSAEVDELLKGVDMLGMMGEAAGDDFDAWRGSHSASIATIIHRLEDLAEGKHPQPRPATVRAPQALQVASDSSNPTHSERDTSTHSKGETPDLHRSDLESVDRTTEVNADFELPALDPMMMEIFREELSHGSSVLRDGILAWEQARPMPEDFLPLLRSCQSIKGASRVVGVDPAVRLASFVEEALTRGQRKEIDLSPSACNILMQASDAFRQMAERSPEELPSWLKQYQQDFVALLDQVAAIPRNNPAPSTTFQDEHFEWFDPENNSGSLGEPTASIPSTSQTSLAHSTSSSLGSSSPPSIPHHVEPETQASSHGTAPSGPQVAPVARTDEEDLSGSRSKIAMAKGDIVQTQDRVVRVKEQSLSRLMGLAGESLVEARWLQPLVASLLKLKRQHATLFDMLDLAAISLNEGGVAAAADRLKEMRLKLENISDFLTDRIDVAEAHARRADEINSRLYNEVISSRMRPFRDGVQGYPRMVRDLSKELGKKVHFDIRGYNTDVDREILEKLESPLTHLLRNALDHGLEPPELRQRAGKSETGRLLLEAHHNAGMLVITVSDDGRGIDLDRLRMKIIERRLATAEMVAVMSEMELLDFLFLPGFSTADNVTEISGRGVGLDVVHSIIQSLGGNIRLSSQKGVGTRFSLYLPITLSVIRAVLVRIAGEYYAFPHHRIERLIRIPREALYSLEDRQYFDADGKNVGVVLAHQLLELRHTEALSPEVNIVLLNHMDEDYGVIVDSFCGEQDLVVRTLDARLGKVRGISSSAILDDGSPILIVDVDDLRRSIEKLLQGGTVHRVDRRDGVQAKGKKRVLVVDDSLTVREVQRQILSNNGYEVETAVDGVDGWNVVRERPFDLVVSDIDMPRMNGLEFVRLIKSHPRLSTVPVVIVSYKDRKEDRLRGLEVGANHYLTKSSFHDNTYLDAVRDLIGAPG